MRGTARVAGLSRVLSRSSLATMTLICIGSLAFSSGCDVSTATRFVDNSQLDQGHVEIDAGVVFSGRPNYLCIPLSRCGDFGSEEIDSISSSCGCVKPSLVRYAETPTSIADGLLLEINPDEAPSEGTPPPMQLGVEVRLFMVDGKTRRVTVIFVETQICRTKARPQ
jgi:hypothetical protein